MDTRHAPESSNHTSEGGALSVDRLVRSLLASADNYCRAEDSLRAVRSLDELRRHRRSKTKAKRHLLRVWHLLNAARAGEPETVVPAEAPTSSEDGLHADREVAHG